jgi:type IV secretory pathway TrbD component
MMYLLQIIIAIVAFLIMLNGFLRGSKKQQADAFLGFLLVGCIVVVFAVYEWKSGLFAIGISFIVAMISRPLAAKAASKLLATGTDKQKGSTSLPSMTLKQISRQLAKPMKYETYEDLLSDEGRVAEDALINYCEANSSLFEVMKSLGVSREELREAYYDLLSAGAGQWVLGHWLAASSLAYPDTLRFVIESKRNNKLGMATFGHLYEHFEKGTPLPENPPEHS